MRAVALRDRLGDPSSAADLPPVVHPPQALHQLVDRHVEGGVLVVETSLGPDHGPLGVAGDLDLLGPAGNPLVGDDDVDAVHLGGERGHLGQSLVELLTESVGDLDVASSDDDLHGSSLIAHVFFVRCSESGFRASGHLGPGPPVIQAPPLPVDLVPGRRPDGRAPWDGVHDPTLLAPRVHWKACNALRPEQSAPHPHRPSTGRVFTHECAGWLPSRHPRPSPHRRPAAPWRLRRTWHPSSRRHRRAGFGVRRSRCATRDSPTGRRRGCHAAQPFPSRTGPPPGARGVVPAPRGGPVRFDP